MLQFGPLSSCLSRALGCLCLCFVYPVQLSLFWILLESIFDSRIVLSRPASALFHKLRLFRGSLSLKSRQLSAIFELSASGIKSILLTRLSKYPEQSPAFWDQHDHLLHNPFMSQFSSALFDQYRFSQYPSIHSDGSSSECSPDLSNSPRSEASQILEDLDPSLNRVNMASPPPPYRLNVTELAKILTTFDSGDSNR